MNYRLRNCEPKDLPDLVQLCESHARFEQTDYDPAGKPEELAKALFGPNPVLYCWVVEGETGIRGYATYTFDYSTWDAAYFLHLDCLYLAPECRGYGIGEEIINRLMKIAKEYACINMQWQTPVFNDRAIKFYTRMGATGKEKVRFSIAIDPS